ncbi:MAG: DUF1905 domain-containing protein [Methylobacterium sp.]|nr:DUF1905 domain-containing protein [Rhodobacter sp.]MCA3649274.1 DUF1905 domain-containing protein [Methylobacterium sp.]MCA3656689.1 DUF1905 domain-containing protein [Methylobacterium sp.]MCA3659493.1 DUF1905 domain-containing protein [Methylobacterium sp.]MCA3660019.1 DUF1905 domain-containing protein [Methylobacterium sp.]
MKLHFTAPLWLWAGKGAWHFITLPEDESQVIRMAVPRGGQNRGWGSVRVTATIGESRWQTSIFPDTGRNAYLLPIKAEIRRAESLSVGEAVEVSLSLDL